jgi:hypothetical protein
MFKPGCREGFIDSEIGMYDFLDSTNTQSFDTKTWSKDTVTQFISALSKNFPDFKNATADTLPDYLKKFNIIATEPEAIYYSQNLMFPYCGYVTQYLKDHPSKIPKNPPTFDGSIQTLRKYYTNLLAYITFIKPEESIASPPPTSYLIYTGKMKAPYNTALYATTTNTNTNTTSTSSSNTLSDADYKSLQTICKNIKY